jgi:hypothetical protein
MECLTLFLRRANAFPLEAAPALTPGFFPETIFSLFWVIAACYTQDSPCHNVAQIEHLAAKAGYFAFYAPAAN